MSQSDTSEAEKILDLNRRFHDEVECHGYDRRMGVRHGRASVAAVIGELERVLGAALPGGGVAVDVGAGTGNIAVKLALDGRFERVVAVDISEGMLGQARAAAEARGVTVETRVSDMRPLPLDDSSVDLVVGCAVLHHLPEVAPFLDEVARVLKPGAPCIFIGEPSTLGARLTEVVKAPAVLASRALRTIRPRLEEPWNHDHIDVHTFTPDDLRRLAAERFADVRLLPEGFAAPILDQGFLVVVQHVFGRVPGVARACEASRGGLRWLDQRWLERVVPERALVSMKFSARRPR